MMKRFFLTTMMILSLLVTVAVADVVVLRDGTCITGEVVGMDREKVTVTTNYGETRVEREKVAAIQLLGTEPEVVVTTPAPEVEEEPQAEVEAGVQTVFGNTVSRRGWLEGTVYYLPRDVNGIPALSSLREAGKLYSPSLDIAPQEIRNLSPITYRREWFAVIYEGEFFVDVEDTYVFSILSDDGARLYIDGKQIIDNDGRHGPRSRRGTLYLEDGVHRVRVTYFQASGNEVALTLKSAREGQTLKVWDVTTPLGRRQTAGWLF